MNPTAHLRNVHEPDVLRPLWRRRPHLAWLHQAAQHLTPGEEHKAPFGSAPLAYCGPPHVVQPLHLLLGRRPSPTPCRSGYPLLPPPRYCLLLPPLRWSRFASGGLGARWPALVRWATPPARSSWCSSLLPLRLSGRAPSLRRPWTAISWNRLRTCAPWRQSLLVQSWSP